MNLDEKYESIQNFRKVQIVQANFMYFFRIIMPIVLVLGSLIVGSILVSIIKFHRELNLFMEVAMFGGSCGIMIVIKYILEFINKLSDAHAHYINSFHSLETLDRLERCYSRAFQVQAIRVPYLLTVTNRTFLTLFHVVLTNVISLILTFP
jgi:hypothetical protein